MAIAEVGLRADLGMAGWSVWTIGRGAPLLGFEEANSARPYFTLRLRLET